MCNSRHRWFRLLTVIALMLIISFTLLNCGGGGGGGSNPAPATNTTYSMSGAITASGAGTSGITVALTGASTATATTDASGNYTFTGLANGSYTVTPTKTGYIFNPISMCAWILIIGVHDKKHQSRFFDIGWIIFVNIFSPPPQKIIHPIGYNWWRINKVTKFLSIRFFKDTICQFELIYI